MRKKYLPVANEQRKQLIDLIHNKGYTIAKAALTTGIYYPTAKAINKVYTKENRTQKKAFRFRLKNIEKNFVVVRQKILVERSCPLTADVSDPSSRICGIRQCCSVDLSKQEFIIIRHIAFNGIFKKSTALNMNNLDQTKVNLIQEQLQRAKTNDSNLRFNFYMYSEKIAKKFERSHAKKRFYQQWKSDSQLTKPKITVTNCEEKNCKQQLSPSVITGTSDANEKNSHSSTEIASPFLKSQITSLTITPQLSFASPQLSSQQFMSPILTQQLMMNYQHQNMLLKNQQLTPNGIPINPYYLNRTPDLSPYLRSFNTC